jgi:hypothetical protein
MRLQPVNFQVESGFVALMSGRMTAVGLTLRSRMPTSVRRLTATPEK